MHYLDSCVLVAALTPEDRSADVDRWLTAHQGSRLFYSDWVTTEFSAALSIKVRLGTIHPSQRARAMTMYAQTVSAICERIEIAARHFDRATRLAEAYETGIRAGDALHVAICLLEPRMQLCTLDKKLGQASMELGVNALVL